MELLMKSKQTTDDGDGKRYCVEHGSEMAMSYF